MKKQITAAIVDDQKHSQEAFGEYLNDWNQSREEMVELTISFYGSGDELLLERNFMNYHIIFMDIVMPGQRNGIKTAEELRRMGYKNALAFMSYHDKYAFFGYGTNALAYIRKHSDTDLMVQKCMDRVLEQLEPKFYHFSNKDMVKMIDCKSIIYIQSALHYIEIITADEVYRQKGRLCSILEQLPAYFVQCHRVNIVNIRHIVRVRRDNVVLSNGENLNVSKSYQKHLSQIIKHDQESSFIDPDSF